MLDLNIWNMIIIIFFTYRAFDIIDKFKFSYLQNIKNQRSGFHSSEKIPKPQQKPDRDDS